MSALLLGLMGGAVAGGTGVLGALTAVVQSHTLVTDEKSIERKLGILLGALFMLVAFSYLNPTLEKMYHGGFASDYEQWSVVAAFVSGLLLMLLFTEFLQEGVAGERAKQENVMSILLILLKNLPIGIAAGAAMNINHSGLSYSILSFIGIHQLFQGIVAALGLSKLGLEAELTIVGSMFIGFVAVISGIFGSVMSQQYFTLMPVMMAFAGGRLMSGPVSRTIEKMKNGPRKIELNPGLFSGMIATLLFIIWKELI